MTHIRGDGVIRPDKIKGMSTEDIYSPARTDLKGKKARKDKGIKSYHRKTFPPDPKKWDRYDPSKRRELTKERILSELY